MLISTKAWHYRFMGFMGFRPYWRDNLCSYVRGFVFSLIKLGFGIVVGLVIAALAVFMLYSMGYALFTGWFNLDTTSTEWLVGTMCWFFACLAGFIYVVSEMYDRRVYKPAGPFKQYIIDRHNKVCRTIQFS